MPLTQLLVDYIRALREEVRGEASSHDTGIHESRAIRQAERAARSGVPVLIQSEAGSGAGALARAIHETGERKGKAFLRWHAGGRTPDNASPLSRRIHEANGGTLLIQGVEELTADEQQALLRLLQDRDMEGSSLRRTSRLDIRLIASTHVDLIERVRAGSFREDLYYRLHILPISLPALRTRREVIPQIATALAHRFALDEGKRIIGLSPEAEAMLMRYDWPGNIRQLENAVFRAVILADGMRLTPTEFPQIANQIQGYRVDVPPAPLARAATLPQRETEAQPDPHTLKLVGETGEMRNLAELEAEIIRFALNHYGGHMSAVSRHLGIGRSTLYRKLKELGLENSEAHVAA